MLRGIKVMHLFDAKGKLLSKFRTRTAFGGKGGSAA